MPVNFNYRTNNEFADCVNKLDPVTAVRLPVRVNIKKNEQGFLLKHNIEECTGAP